MKPTVGRSIHYYPPQECRSDNCQEFFAGIITEVLDDTFQMVNLVTFGSTSVYFNSHVLPFDPDYPRLGGWAWPPRV